MTQTAPHGQEPVRRTPPSFGGGVPPVPDASQAGSVAAWLGWHAAELAGVGVPLALALAVSWWFVVLMLPAAGLWIAQEARPTRRQVGAADARDALTSPATDEENDER